jgi:hypothetical protein
LTIKHKKLALGKLLASSILSSKLQRIKYPDGSQIGSTKFEPNAIEIVKNARNEPAKMRSVKLFRNKKK